MPRIRSTYLALALLLLIPVLCAGQIPDNRQTNAQILVRVTLDNERPAGDRIHVELLTNVGVAVANAYTDADGRATFTVTFPGEYRLQVEGSTLQGAVSTSFRVDDLDKSKTIFVKVKPKIDRPPRPPSPILRP